MNEELVVGVSLEVVYGDGRRHICAASLSPQPTNSNSRRHVLIDRENKMIARLHDTHLFANINAVSVTLSFPTTTACTLPSLAGP